MELKQCSQEIDLDESLETLKILTKSFKEISVELSHSHAREFALKFENEKLGVRLSELYKKNAELEAEIKNLKGEK